MHLKEGAEGEDRRDFWGGDSSAWRSIAVGTDLGRVTVTRSGG